TKSLSHLSRPGHRVLNADELWSYWQRLAGIKSEAIRGALQLALLLGGQRIQQLLRLTRSDVDLQGGFVTLHDPKGRRTQPRIHELAVTDEAMSMLSGLMARAAALESKWVFTSGGRVAVDHVTLTNEVKKISEAMLTAKESVDSFSLRDLRRTVETMLAKMNV